MTQVFVSYARATEEIARLAADTLRQAGYEVWRDDALPAHRAYGEVIEERLADAAAVLVLWSADAARSEWVRSEANAAREQRKLVQARTDATRLPMPFDQVQCADLVGWAGDTRAPGWLKVLESVAALVHGERAGGAASTQGAARAVQPPSAPAWSEPRDGRPTIAVLPFSNLSGDAAQDYFAQGVAEDIIDALSRSRALFVLAAGSSLAPAPSGRQATEAARELGVRYVLEGSVRRAGERVRIAVRLIDGVDGAALLAERYDGTVEDLFELQDRVALAVAGRVEPAVEQAEIKRALAHPLGAGTAHDIYLRALHVFRSHTPQAMLDALALLEQALSVDPTHALALSLAASCHRSIVVGGWSGDTEGHRQRGCERAREAARAGRDDPKVLASVANDLTVLERSIEVALPLAQRAVALDPGSANVLFNAGCVHVMAGELDAAAEQFERAMARDPGGTNRPAYLLWFAATRMFAGNFDEAARLLLERNQFGESVPSVLHLAACLGYLGRLEEARDALARYRALTPMTPEDFVQIWMDPAQRAIVLEGLARLDGFAANSTAEPHVD